MKRKLVLALLVALIAAQTLAVGTQTVTTTRLNSGLIRVSVAWTSDGSGNVSGNPVAAPGLGQLVQVEFVPGSGAVQPDNNYDVTLADQYGVDLLVANGQNLSNATSKQLLFSPMSIIDATLTFTVSGAGAANSGTVLMWIRQ